MRQIWTTPPKCPFVLLKTLSASPRGPLKGPVHQGLRCSCSQPTAEALHCSEHTPRPGHRHFPAAGELGCLDRLATRNPGEVPGPQPSSAAQKGQGSPQAQRSFPS